MNKGKLVYPDVVYEQAVKKYMHDICAYDKTDEVNGSGYYMQCSSYLDWVKKEMPARVCI